MTTQRRRLVHPVAALAVSVLIGFGLGGCYHHVVAVKGPGMSNYDVYEPNFKPEEEVKIKNWFGSIFGASNNKK